MLHLRAILSGAALALVAAGGMATSAMAKPAYVASTVNLRQAPGTTSEIVGKIPGGSLVDASECTEGWCAVTWQGKAGFSIESSLDMSGRVPQQQQRRAAAGVRRPLFEADEYEEPVYYGPPPPMYVRPYYYGRPYGYRWRRW